MSLVIDGKTYTVPGVYGTVEVSNLGNVALPAFNNLLIIGQAKKGIPYNATGKKGYEVIKSFASLNSAEECYGTGDLINGLNYAQRGGAGVIYGINVASLTLAKATVKDNDEFAPADTFDLTPQDKHYGAPGNDISISIATQTVTIIPPKLHKFLTADAAVSSKEISLDNFGDLAVGQTIFITDNDQSAPQETTISAIDLVNEKIILADLPSAAYAKTSYARIFQEDTDKQEVKTFDANVTVSEMIDWISAGQILTADRSTYTGLVPTTLAKTHIQNFAGATKGTSPDATETADGDYDSLADLLPQFFEEFTSYTKVRLRLVCVLTGNSAVHAVYKTLAQTLRANQYSVQIIVGTAKGDIALAESNSAHPIPRAKALNSDDVILSGMGIDNLAAYISSAPLIAGMISGNSVKRNLTNDSINAVVVETFFGQSNKETDTAKYLANGIIVFGTGKNGYYLIQGVNTYQNQATVWNEADGKTYLIMQRQIVDFVYEGYKNQMEVGVGVEGYDEMAASAKGIGILDQYVADKFITDRKILKAYKEGNAIITEPQITPIGTTDFVGFIMKIVIP